MGSLLVDLRKLRQDNRFDRMHPSEQRALENTLKEADEHGADLRTSGFGGLPASLALGIYRRDGFRCKKCGTAENLGLHHKGGEKTSRHAWRHKANTTNNLVVLCHSCHNTVHTEDNEAVKEQNDG